MKFTRYAKVTGLIVRSSNYRDWYYPWKFCHEIKLRRFVIFFLFNARVCQGERAACANCKLTYNVCICVIYVKQCGKRLSALYMGDWRLWTFDTLYHSCGAYILILFSTRVQNNLLRLFISYKRFFNAPDILYIISDSIIVQLRQSLEY